MPRTTTPAARITVDRIEGPGEYVRFTIGFDPTTLEPERRQQAWESLAGLVSAVLDKQEIAEFLGKFEAILVSSDTRPICVVYGPAGAEIPEGNANLIAAALDLLAALKEVVRLSDRKTDAWDAAKAAIAKAEGL